MRDKIKSICFADIEPYKTDGFVLSMADINEWMRNHEASLLSGDIHGGRTRKDFTEKITLIVLEIEALRGRLESSANQ